MGKKKARGLGALLARTALPEGAGQPAVVLRELPVAEIEPNPNQVRGDFDEDALRELADSVARHGILQPVVVRDAPGRRGGYELVAGERRLRAAEMAGLATIPAILRTADDLASAELSLVENLQRTDLNPIEEARGYLLLSETFNLTQGKIAERVGKSRPAVANSLRLLDLEIEIQELVVSGGLSAGHARALLALPPGKKRIRLALKAVSEDWSVREVERHAAERKERKKRPLAASTKAAHIRRLEERIEGVFGTRVTIVEGKKSGKGKLIIEFYSNEDFARILDVMGISLG